MIGPGDLIALVTFDGEVYANLAVTRERLGRPQQAPHALAAALAHWLRRKHLWLEVRGRQIHGIATARPLGDPRVWQIDTLIDAGRDDEPHVVRPLLAQAEAEALRSGVGQLLLRMPEGAAATDEAVFAGFVPALQERLWRAGRLQGDAVATAAIEVREAGDADWFGRFQLYNRTLPVGARRAIALTLDEWRSTREEHWLGRHPHDYVALDGGQIVGALRAGSCQAGAQLELLVAPGATKAAAPLLAAGAPHCESTKPVFALAPCGATAVEQALADTGFEAGEEYLLLSRRLERPVEETVPAGAGIALPSGG